MYSNTNEKTPNGNTACGATTAVMLINAINPQLYNLEQGNNPTNLSLRDNIFTANPYVKSIMNTARPTNCDYTALIDKNTRAVSGEYPVDGAWKITSQYTTTVNIGGVTRKLCTYNSGTGIQNYLNAMGLRARSIPATEGPNETMYNTIKQSIDNGQPILVYASFPAFPHVLLIKGYTDKPGYFIFNDPFGNSFAHSSLHEGNGIIYNMNGYESKMVVTSLYAVYK